MGFKREFRNSPLPQGIDERVAYTVDTTKWPGTGSPTGIVVKTFDEAGTDTSVTNLSGAASESAGIITTPLVIALTAGDRFRLEVQWVKSGDTWEGFGFLDGET